MLVDVYWSELRSPRNSRWYANFCLYAYFHPRKDLLLYVGKADFATVRERLSGKHKYMLYDDIAEEYDLEPGDLRFFQGELALEENRRLSCELLADVETLLIKRLLPFGNIQARRNRIARPGLHVYCVGEWPLKKWPFLDPA